MWARSELSYRLEPHDCIYSAVLTRTAVPHLMLQHAVDGGVPGVVHAGWVPGGRYTGYYPPIDPEAGLTLI